MADQVLFQCPNCGASIKNSLNCEYCGSLLIRFEAQNIPLNLVKYGKDGFSFPGLEDALKRNIELQKKHPGVNTCTDIDESTGTVNLQVSKSGMIEGESFDPFTDKPGLEVALRFLSDKSADFQYYKIFEKLDIFGLFKTNLVDYLQDQGMKPFKECYIDFGEDYVSASRMITTIIKEVYGMDESTVFTYNTWSDAEDATPAPANNAPAAKQGCYVATAVYGSYDCPSVWTLRRFRDNTLDATWYGRLFIKTYYAISPTVVKLFGNTQWFNKMWREPLDKLVAKLRAKGVESTPYNDKY